MSGDPISIRLGETWTREFTVTDENGDPVDLTDYTITCQGRETTASTGLLWDLSDGSGITVTPATGVVKLTITLDTTVTARTGEYDVKAEDGDGNVSYPKYGQVKIIPAITRAAS